MEWLVAPNDVTTQAECTSYTPTCGHKCSDYCGTKEGCGILVCSDKGCSDYNCIILFG